MKQTKVLISSKRFKFKTRDHNVQLILKCCRTSFWCYIKLRNKN